MFLKLSMLPPRHGSNSLKLHVMEEEEEEGGGGGPTGFLFST